ncbi:uncharacterized protein FIESC28_06021 [Fusarium coffeatum]|uniref:Uncharacterized protein n=1 Tax=Fusarium coffeatum TaxID=231269 RepID=A0A366RQ18_9HYPO|nr:uncharacterized protein FIESC28_06021 [Fusarium coffeatum]RBR18566.1 hypothetical protein FIESC28_06021 [Fusarium coffeatum]
MPRIRIEIRQATTAPAMDSLQHTYNNLKDVDEASRLVEACPGVLDSLANLLVKHKLHDFYDILLNHKHFDITRGEKVVTFHGNRNMAVSVVCKDGECPRELLASEGIEPAPGGKVIPSDFIIKNGRAIAYEFVYTHTNEIPSLSSEFVQEWSDYLRDQGLDSFLGLCIREEGVPFDALEVSDSENRINRLFFKYDRAEGDIDLTTSWRVNEQDGVAVAMKCRYCKTINEHERKCMANN